MSKYLITSLLVVGLAGPALAGDEVTFQHVDRLSVGNYGHPDPCWSLRLRRHINRYWWWRFEDCLRYYNYNN